ncbi:hypothetical protein SprV_0100424900 [Sparganum proliferum]
MRQARDRQRESIALSGSNPGKSVANIFRHRSCSKRGYELPPLLNDNKVFLIDDTDKAGQPLSNFEVQKDLGVPVISSFKPLSQCQGAARRAIGVSFALRQRSGDLIHTYHIVGAVRTT